MEVVKNLDGSLTIQQPGLIDKVINAYGLENESNVHLTPADKILHDTTPVIEPRLHQWSYRQEIGILNYIAASTRPDIMFAVHQCARFSANPK
jgi:hypothetical protein